jgi:Mg-chelatase subunit ChlD
MPSKKSDKKKAKKKTKTGITHIHMVLDRTGSMSGIKVETIGGVNAFIADQKKEKGEATFSLVQFDSADPYEVLQDWVDIKKAEDLNEDTYAPRGMTPLLDAIGKAITDVDAKIKAKRSKKPDKVVMVIITDGAENASHEFDKDGLKKLIDEREKAGWRFVFIGADFDAFGQGAAFGLNCKSSNVLNTTKSAAAIGRTFLSTSSAMSRMRGASVPRSKTMSFYSEGDYKAQEDLGADNSKAKPKK